MPNPRQAALGLAIVALFFALTAAVPPLGALAAALRDLPATLAALDTAPLGHAIGAAAVDNPLLTLGVLAGLAGAAVLRSRASGDARG